MTGIFNRVEKYFAENLPGYQLVTIFHRYGVDDDAHYHVVGRKVSDGTYTHWSSWYDDRNSLNHGTYGIVNLERYLESTGLKQYVADVDTKESNVIHITSTMNEWIDIMIFPLEDERFFEAKLMASRAFGEWCQNGSQEAVGSYLELRMKEAGIPCIFYYPGERNGN